jgi:predicted RNase H-like HicB family nuclease
VTELTSRACHIIGPMKPLRVEFDRETDGRWIAEIPALPGVMVYGRTRADALRKVKILAFEVLAQRLRQGRRIQPRIDRLFAVT